MVNKELSIKQQTFFEWSSEVHRETVSAKLSAIQLTVFSKFFSLLHITKFHIVHACSANHLYHTDVLLGVEALSQFQCNLVTK